MSKLNSEPKIGGAGSYARWIAGNVLGLASSRVWEAGSGPHGKSCKSPTKTKKTKKEIKKTEITKLRVATWNVGTLTHPTKQAEVCETVELKS